ncbi:Uncharacterised protein [Escherichia coli]|nr:Uncharacterised protein [Escherichia coli]
MVDYIFITGLLANLSIWWYTQEKAFPVSFAIQGGSSPRKPHFPFSRLVQFIECFINFSLFLRGWISSNNPGCAIPDGVKSASMTPAFI